MKRIGTWMLLVLMVCTLMLAGCKEKEASVVKEYAKTYMVREGEPKTYCQMSDGTWKYQDRIYQHRVELETSQGGRIVVLTDKKDLSYDEVMRRLIESNYETIQKMQKDNLIVEELAPGT